MANDTDNIPIFHGFVIYALTDPRDGLIRYIGITNNLYSRVGSHLRELGSRTTKGIWLADLDSEGLLPTVHVVEKVQVARKDRHLAEARERYWIEYYKQAGMPLINVTHVQTGKSRNKYRNVSIHKSTRKEIYTLEQLRVKAGLHLDDLAKLSRVSSTSLHKMMRGEKVSGSLVERVLRALSRKLGKKLFFDNIRGVNYL